jgi:hypothetical protein
MTTKVILCIFPLPDGQSFENYIKVFRLNLKRSFFTEHGAAPAKENRILADIRPASQETLTPSATAGKESMAVRRFSAWLC